MLRRDRWTGRGLHDLVQGLRDCDPALIRAIEAEFCAGSDFPAADPVPGLGMARLDPAAPPPPTPSPPARSGFADPLTGGGGLLEAIIWRKGRPALAIRSGRFETDDRTDPQASVLLDRLEAARAHLECRIPAVGRIEVEGNAEGEAFGTGWLVTPQVIVTNAHVARKFAMSAGHGFRFRSSFTGDGRQSARIDFLAEQGLGDAHEVAITDILWIASDGEADIAFLGLEHAVDIPPIPLADAPTQPGAHVAAIGYPMRDYGYPDPVLMEAIFGGLYGYKCLSPGLVRSFTGSVLHDCSTLPGNSGSPIIDLTSGLAVGLHFVGGRLEGDNHAIPAAVVADRLARLGLN